MSVSYGKGDRGKATKLHSKIVRARGHCERCGESRYEKLQTAHIVRRGAAHTRTDTANAWCLCASCHFKVDNDPWLFMELVENTCGDAFYLGLRQKAQDGVRVKMDWQQEVARLKEIADALGGVGVTNIGFCDLCDRYLGAYLTLVKFDRRAALGALQAYDAHRDSVPHPVTP